jgi:hypothetical protein
MDSSSSANAAFPPCALPSNRRNFGELIDAGVGDPVAAARS